jgi:hypothetical protein
VVVVIGDVHQWLALGEDDSGQLVI